MKKYLIHYWWTLPGLMALLMVSGFLIPLANLPFIEVVFGLIVVLVVISIIVSWVILLIRKQWKKCLYSFLITILAVCPVFIPMACGKNYNGIDISHHNSIDWNAVKDDENIKFCYIKSTQGSSHVDDRYQDHMRKAKDACLKVGLYHYFSSHTPGETQFENFNKCLRTFQWDLIPVIDIETPDNDFSDIRGLKTILSDFLEAFYTEYNYYPIVYYGDLNAYRLFGTTIKCRSWFRTLDFSWFLPFVCFQQVAEAEKFNGRIDLDYCKNLDYILVKQ